MKEKLSADKNIVDYTQSKDAYEGNRESAVYKDSLIPPVKQQDTDSEAEEQGLVLYSF